MLARMGIFRECLGIFRECLGIFRERLGIFRERSKQSRADFKSFAFARSHRNISETFPEHPKNIIHPPLFYFAIHINAALHAHDPFASQSLPFQRKVSFVLSYL